MTTASGTDDMPAAEGQAFDHARHIPVLLDEVVQALSPAPHTNFIDGTFGAGGYTRALLATPDTHVLAFDRDPNAIRDGAALVAKMGGRLNLAHAPFSSMAEVAHAQGLTQFDGITLDVGVSSMQIDEAGRGFSFRFEGPLDMRMAQEGRSAADILNTASDEEIANILYYYGEERDSRRIARAIVHDRDTTPFTTTKQLADLLGRLLPSRPTDIHPATRTFQALRIAVNDELGELVQALGAAERLLKPGGRLAIVSFHSLEDRIVKQFFSHRSGRGQAQSRLLPGEPIPAAPTFELPAGQPITAGPQELARNPRARSAKLRVAIRTDAPARAMDSGVAALAALPTLKSAPAPAHKHSKRNR